MILKLRSNTPQELAVYKGPGYNRSAPDWKDAANNLYTTPYNTNTNAGDRMTKPFYFPVPECRHCYVRRIDSFDGAYYSLLTKSPEIHGELPTTNPFCTELYPEDFKFIPKSDYLKDTTLEYRDSADSPLEIARILNEKENNKMEIQERNKTSKLSATTILYDIMSNSGVFDTARMAITGPIQNTIAEWLDERVYCSFSIIGHFDTFISKSSTKVLLKYLKPKYGKKILYDVDSNFAMCSTSLQKAKKTVLAFPELVNKTIRPGIYFNTLDKHGTKLIVVKIALYESDDISANGVKSTARQFKTFIITMGPAKSRWIKHIASQIDSLCSKIVSTATASDKIRVSNLSSSEVKSTDIQVRSIDHLTFPQKENLLRELDRFSRNGKIYKENGIPHRLGMLFSGPRGVGKTSTAYSIAKNLDMQCVSVDLSYFDNNSGSNAFGGSNAVYIIDEIDAQLPKIRDSSDTIITENQQKMRDRLIKLLKAMDEMGNGSIIIATTNYPENLDPALIRSGRFDEIIKFDNLDRTWAEKMVLARDLDPEYVLRGQTFPINPASLEQLIISRILKKNDIKLRKEVAVEKLINETTSDVGEPDDDDDDDYIVVPDGSVDTSYCAICNDDDDIVETEDDED